VSYAHVQIGLTGPKAYPQIFADFTEDGSVCKCASHSHRRSSPVTFEAKRSDDVWKCEPQDPVS